MEKIRFRCVLYLTILLIFSLAACGEEAAETEAADAAPLTVADGFTFDTDDFTPPAQQNPKEQDLGSIYLRDLERPEALIYVVDGKARVFSEGDPKFEKILELNNNRDTTQPVASLLGALRRNAYASFLSDEYWTHGRYLFYRYPEDANENCFFSLPKEREVNLGGQEWTYPWANVGGIYGDLAAADELIAYIEGE